MSALTDKLSALVSQLEAKGVVVEKAVLAEVRALAEKLKSLVGLADEEVVKVSDAVVAEANKVETAAAAPEVVQVNSADAGTGTSASA